MNSARQAALVADPDDYFKLAVDWILKSKMGFSTVYMASSLDEALEQLLAQSDITLSVLDLGMPGMNGATSLTAVRDCFPKVQVAVLSASTRRHDVLRALDAGAHGIIPKSVSPEDMAAALKMIVEGIIYVPPCVVSTSSLVVEGPVLSAEAARSTPSDVLTPRQREVLELLIEGKSNKEIARALNLGEGTVKVHMAGLFRGLGVNTRAAAAAVGTNLLNGWYSGA